MGQHSPREARKDGKAGKAVLEAGGRRIGSGFDPQGEGESEHQRFLKGQWVKHSASDIRMVKSEGGAGLRRTNINSVQGV